MQARTSSLLQSMQSLWLQRAPRERVILGTAAAFLAAVLLWTVALSPALRTLRQAEASQQTLQTSLQNMLQMQAQAKGLQAQPALDHNATLQTLQTTLSSTLGPTARLQVVGDQAVVTLADASPQALGQWLSQARINARSAPTQAKLTRTDKAPGASAQWSGTLHMALPAKP